MQKREWAKEASEKLQLGQSAIVYPRGQSMRGRISDGDAVTLEPCLAQNLLVGDIVLCRIEGRRFSHLVLHLIVGREAKRFLIGNNFGRVDGWISSQDIFGKVTKVEPQTAVLTKQPQQPKS